MPDPRLLACAAAVAALTASAAAGAQTMGTQPSASPSGMSGAQTPSGPGAMGAPGAMPPAMTQAPGTAAPMGGMAPSGTSGMAMAYTPITPQPALNIVAELQSAGEFKTLLDALSATNLTTTVQSTPNLTLLAPTDAAFAMLPPGALDALKKDPAKLQALLTYHLIAAKVTEDQVKGHAAGKVATAARKTVTFDGSGPTIKINDATVLQSAVPASNGVIYVIDKVLTPAM